MGRRDKLKLTADRVLDRALESEPLLKSWHHGGGKMKRWKHKPGRRKAPCTKE